MRPLTKILKGKRTAIVGAVFATFGAIQTADLSFLPPHWSGPVILGAGVAMIWLRALTDTPIGQKGE